MKKLLVILASALMVMAVAISCGNKNEKKALDLTEKAINAAKAGDVPAFTEAMFAISELNQSLSEEENEAIEKMLEEKISEDDRDLFEDFFNENQYEIIQYAQDHNLIPEGAF